MKNKLLAAALCLLALASLAFVQQPKRVAWEYTETRDFRKANTLGADGWELVATEGSGVVSTFYFKRAK